MKENFLKDGSSEKSYIAFFDLDETILSINSGRAIVKESYKRSIMGKRWLAKAMYLSVLYKTNIKNTLKIIYEMISWLEGFSEQAFENLSSDVCAHILVQRIHQEVVPELNMHRKQNARLVILSSALKPVCARIAESLDMDDVICTELEVADGIFTGRPVGKPCFEEVKAERLKSYCEKHRSDPKDAWYYGDSIADRHVLGIVGNPVCVNPDKKLKRIAQERKWKISEWH